jgi:hypothetical protein
MNQTSNCPIFVDGQRICEAHSVSYTIEREVEYNGRGFPGDLGYIETDPPAFAVTLELPEGILLSIDHESRVEVAIPPDVHGGAKWRVIEVWEIHHFEQAATDVEIAAYQGDLHTGVEYLGDDTNVAKDKRGLVEPEDNFAIDISDSDEESPETDDADFTANVEDI